MTDKEGNIVQSYSLDVEPTKELSVALKETVEILFGTHAALRMELVGGQ
ncbi:MAG: hypothetical protein L0H94_13960 [Nitrospira sp.]|nr:hypothetical protein [Nitrospira sp.]